MKDMTTPRLIKLKDYRVPDYLIPEVELCFELDPECTYVTNQMQVKKNPKSKNKNNELFLNGENICLERILLNGNLLSVGADYVVDEAGIRLFNLPEEFELSIENTLNPSSNKALEGLYKVEGMYCSQNEPEGFRRITFFQDRSDVMSRYRTKIIANKQQNPILLSNGNPVESGDLPEGKHFVVWEDPFKKPSYLFALVAGDLALLEDRFKTKSGRQIDLRLYCDKGSERKLHHAMDSLKKAMRWDEEVYGLEYDLDIYMIVAVDSFNMGAMENKGLNIFNTTCVMADPKSATDEDYLRVEGVVGHEYFHNWTGNRVTCRDWFQLTLKEGLTVFRDQEFSADMFSRPVQRIGDVTLLRRGQFPEDAGPNAHPIRPESYIEINNFYTSTVYNKGAEVIRMVHTLLGAEGFRKGMDKYFELYDGQAVTTEDFLYAMQTANQFDLEKFKIWYSEAGTPEIKVSCRQIGQKIKLKLSQDKDFYFPFKIGFLTASGDVAKVSPQDSEAVRQEQDSYALTVSKRSQEFVFKTRQKNLAVSLNRDFSAPIKVKTNFTPQQLAFLMGHDKNEFARWDAAQELAKWELEQILTKWKKTGRFQKAKYFLKSFGQLLVDTDLDPAFKALSLRLPSVDILVQEQSKIDFASTFKAREFLLYSLAESYFEDLFSEYQCLHSGQKYAFTPAAVGDRMLKNTCLSLLRYAQGETASELALEQFKSADNMTDQFAALRVLVECGGEARDEALEEFYKQWKNDVLVMNKWFQVQALSSGEDTFERVKKLFEHKSFDIQNPNKVKSLLGVFARANEVHFHHPSGRGYSLLAEKIITIDAFNPLVSSSLGLGFNLYKRLEKKQKEKMQIQLERIVSTPKLSKNTYEIVSKILEN